MSTEAGGPYVQVAAVCERVLNEKDGVLSLIRLVDRFTVPVPAPASGGEAPAVTINAFLVIALKAGFYEGKGTLRVVPTSPSGKKQPELSSGILLEGQDRGVNVVLQLQFVTREEGLHWFDVLFENQLLTRIPLRVLFSWIPGVPKGGPQ